MNGERRELGVVVGGSLSEGLRMKLHPDRTVEDDAVRAGNFVVVVGDRYEFFSMITDVTLGASSPEIMNDPPPRDSALMRRVLSGTATFGTISLRPMLMLGKGQFGPLHEDDLRPVKTVPGHFALVYEATEEDVACIFGSESADIKFFNIGRPLEQETPVCLNLDRFVERSNGIFGKSGTGKTYLTRIALCGLIKNARAVNLIFDMHSEYGWKGTTEEAGRESVWGLRQYFSDKVAVFSLDPLSSKRRGAPIDFEVKIPYTQVTVEDIALLQHELNLTNTAVETCYALLGNLGDGWLGRLIRMSTDEIADFAKTYNVHTGALAAIQRKLNVLVRQCEGFLQEAVIDDAVERILEYLDRETHVVMEFGQYSKPLQYMLVANILTRRIHERYVARVEQAMGEGRSRPKPLVITIEEAHKFLNPALSRQTIFGTIAREMRKYAVTLLIVDQRPSGIDDEVLSQLGTRITCLLNDERDIEAVMTGLSNASSLRGVLASLDSKQQALILGHAVPMPVVVRTRVYDDPLFRKCMRPDLEDRAALVSRLTQLTHGREDDDWS
ncbi:MAG: ATP-binding protein [Armatimonadetes bacterium]|nr:ATP-binding protein [Armatimonadota bacterium]